MSQFNSDLEDLVSRHARLLMSDKWKQLASGPSKPECDWLSEVSGQCSGFISGALSELGEFQRNFDRNPSYAFEWSGQSFEAAARADIGRGLLVYVLGGLDRVFDPENPFTAHQLCVEVRNLLQSEARAARWVDESTSLPSNYLAAKRKAFSVDLFHRLVLDSDSYSWEVS